jgi:hypothetical protein
MAVEAQAESIYWTAPLVGDRHACSGCGARSGRTRAVLPPGDRRRAARGSIECGYAALHSESAQSQDGAPLCDSPLRSATWAAAITTLVGTALLALGAALTPTHLTRGSALAVAALLSVAALVLAWQANR